MRFRPGRDLLGGPAEEAAMGIRFALFLLTALNAGALFAAETTEELLSRVGQLVAEKKYLSAFEALNGYADGDSIPDIALK